MSVRIAVSIGDINGIGPEVILKSIASSTPPDITPIILANEKIVAHYADMLNIDLSYHSISEGGEIRDGVINILHCIPDKDVHITPGKLTDENGKNAMRSVEKGMELCLENRAGALVTAPISKEAVNLAGYRIPGHTEFLAEKTDTKDYLMMLVHEQLRVGLVTIHEPISEVPSLLTAKAVGTSVGIMHHTLLRDFNIHQPRIAVLGLNPHAGDGGIIGNEEISIIQPALEQARSRGIKVSDPLPADGFFGNRKYKNYDAVLAMYHDQGLIPFKTLSFGSGVNFTAGLPIVRTSPDHGTAFDIAGKNKADPSSFQQALKMAAKLSRNRNKEAL